MSKMYPMICRPGSVPEELEEEKMRLEVPTMKTPTSAKMLPAT